MSWYYSEDGKQMGPVSDEDWNSLTAGGKFNAQTMVWREGMAAWQPYGSVSSGGGAAMPSAVGTSTVTCSFCQKSYPADEVISMDGRLVCENCKPMAVQLVKEGMSLPGEMNYAGFGIRFGAKFIDGIILWIVNFGVNIVFAMLMGPVSPETDPKQIMARALILVIPQLAVQGAYSIFFTGKMGGTPGKLACGLRVVRPDGSPLSYGRATGRFFAEFVSGLTIGIGYLMAAFDDQKRSLHDRIADTRVIKK